MQIGQPQENLNNVEPSHILSQPPILLNQPKQLPPSTVLQHKHNIFLSLERILQLNNKRMPRLLHNNPLVHHNLLLLIADHHLFFNQFHRVEIVIDF